MLANVREFVTESYDDLLQCREDEGSFAEDPLEILISLEEAGVLEIIEF